MTCCPQNLFAMLYLDGIAYRFDQHHDPEEPVQDGIQFASRLTATKITIHPAMKHCPFCGKVLATQAEPEEEGDFTERDH